jgi:hypothetical protein
MMKTQPTEKPTRAALEKRIAQLRRLDCDLLQEQIALEKAKVVPIAETHPTVRLRVDAEAMFDGVQPDAPSPDSGNRLWQVISERKIILKALELGSLRLTRLMGEQAAEISKDLEIAWRKNIRETASLVEQIQKLAAAQEHLRSEWCVRTGLGVMPPAYMDGQRLVAPQSPLAKFLETARRLGLTEKA